MLASWQVSWTLRQDWYDRWYFFFFSPWPPSQSLLGSECEVMVSTRVKAVGVSVLDRVWDPGLPWCHQRPTEGAQEVTLLCLCQLGEMQRAHPGQPSLSTAGDFGHLLSFRLSCLKIGWENPNSHVGLPVLADTPCYGERGDGLTGMLCTILTAFPWIPNYSKT